jgi:uncharacterized protein (DUF1778 family)
MPTVDEAKTKNMSFRLLTADDALFREAAAIEDETVTDFLVESGRERAERLLADRTEFALGPAEWDAFTAALDRPAEVSPELRDLFSRQRPS